MNSSDLLDLFECYLIRSKLKPQKFVPGWDLNSEYTEVNIQNWVKICDCLNCLIFYMHYCIYSTSADLMFLLKSVSQLVREAQVMKEQRDQQIAELKTLAEQNGETAQHDSEKKVSIIFLTTTSPSTLVFIIV